MSANIQIIHAHEIIKAIPEGKLDFEETKKLLKNVALASYPLVAYEIILDTRKASSILSITDIWFLVEELSKFRKTFTEKIAVLCPFEEFDKASFFALCSKNRGFQVNAFTSYEEAIDWLIMV